MPDPLYYIPQVIFFVIGSILFGNFVYALRKEILAEGWIVSPRTVWFSCLCCSSFMFALYQCDPYSMLGLFTHPWVLFMMWLCTALTVDSVACALYMYVIVFYRQHMSGVPVMLTRVWVGTNALSTCLTGLVALIGTITDGIFWYGLVVIFVILQEAMVIVVLNISLHKVMLVLWKLRSPEEDFHGALRKMWICRLATSILGLIAIGNQFFGTEDGLLRLDSWGKHLATPSTQEFDSAVILPELLTVLIHVVLLYMMRRPAETKNTITRLQPAKIRELSQPPSTHSQTSCHSQQ